MNQGPQLGRPPAFETALGTIVFAKFHRAEHRIVIDAATRKGRVISWIDLEIDQAGHPVIELDVIGSGDAKVEIDGKSVDMAIVHSPGSMREEFYPEEISRYLVPAVKLAAGRHRFEIEHELEKGFTANGSEVNLYFKMDDRWVPESDRFRHHFLDRYLPSNLEFDQHPRAIELYIGNTRTRHQIWTNGSVAGDGFQRWRVEFPGHFTSACPFLVVAPASQSRSASAVHFGARRIPIRVFGDSTRDVDEFVARALPMLKRLESDLGPIPHERLLIYAGGGAMEYFGAIDTTLSHLKHELVHCYVGRGVLPGSGDAGWIDEAIAEWYVSVHGPGNLPSHEFVLSELSPYLRGTPAAAYTVGVDFIAYLDAELARYGGFVAFVRDWVARRRFQIVDTETMIDDLEEFSGRSFRAEFDEAVFNYRRSK